MKQKKTGAPNLSEKTDLIPTNFQINVTILREKKHKWMLTTA